MKKDGNLKNLMYKVHKNRFDDNWKLYYEDSLKNKNIQAKIYIKGKQN